MGRICLDFDGTVAIEDEVGAYTLIEGAREAVEELKAQGHEIIIYTSRIGLAAREGTLKREIEILEDVLREFQIPYDSIFMGEKIVADVYIDDRAVAFDGDWSATFKQALAKLTPPDV